MDYIRRADILKCRALAATPFFHDSNGYKEGKVVENKNPNIMYLVSTYRGRATPRHTQLPNNARNQQAIYTKPNPTDGNTQHTSCNHRTNKMRLHDAKSIHQKKAVTRNKGPEPKVCNCNEKSAAMCKPKTKRSYKFATEKQVPITGIKTFQAPQRHCNGSTSSEEETNKSAQERKKERKEKRGKKAALVLPHIVSPQRFGTWSIYTLLVDQVHTYLGGVDQWSRWPMA